MNPSTSSVNPEQLPPSVLKGPSPFGIARVFTWNRFAMLLWGLVFVGIAIRVGRAPHRVTSFSPYFSAGEHWRHAEPLYQAWKGFVYGPLIAAFFSLFTAVSEALGNVLWRFLNAGVLLWGLLTLFTKGPFGFIDRRRWGVVFVLVLPLVLGNLDNAQANPMVIGLIMLGVSAACAGQWTWSAVAIGLATHLKIYPIAVGMLLCVVAPRKMPVRFALVLLALTLLPFALQRPDYVSAQYLSWVHTRAGDDRLAWGVEDAPLDAAYLLTRLAHIPVSLTAFRIAEVLGGGLLAVFCAWMAARQWAMRQMLANVFVLACIWMLLLGPATESFTYALLAPCAALCALQTLEFKTPRWLRGLAWAPYLLLLAVAAKNSLAPHFRSVSIRAMQPVSALVLLAFAVGWIEFSRRDHPRDGLSDR